MPRSHEDLLHRVLEGVGQLLERAREQGRHLGQLPVQRHGRRLRRAHFAGGKPRGCVGRLHRGPERRQLVPDVVDAEGLPARALLRGPECGAFAAAERRLPREQRREALPDDGEHLRLRCGRPEVDEPLQLGRLRNLLYPVVAKLAPQLRVLDPQVRDLRLQGTDLGIPAQQLVLHVRRLLLRSGVANESARGQYQRLRLSPRHVGRR